MKSLKLKHYSLAVLSGILLSLPWVFAGVGLIVLVGFIPLLIIAADINVSYLSGKSLAFNKYAFISMFIWNATSLWWLVNASLIAAIAVIIVYSVLMAMVWAWFFIVYKRFGRNLALIFFVSLWISFEFIMMKTQISRPWMNLGNAFSYDVSLVQWYEYTGVFGGSLWVLLINVILFFIFDNALNRIKNINPWLISFSILLFSPIIFSIIRYNNYSEKVEPVKIVILQPNIDSYTEKYSMPIREQIDIILDIANEAKAFSPDYYVAPETALPIGIREEMLDQHFTVEMFRNFLMNTPDAQFVVGATTRVVYPSGIGKSAISQPLGETGDYYDLFNSALQIDTALIVDVYHKSRLVPGVEFLPFPKILGLIDEIVPDFGGLSGNHGTQDYREVFLHENTGLKAGVPICYESVYGDCVGEFVKEGAQILIIITNDGWWGNSEGHRRHNSLSSLRAIETRRSIARSANTGISCFVNQRGDVVSFLGYNEKGFIYNEINANSYITFYVKHGDFVGRIFTAIGILLNLAFLGILLRKRFSTSIMYL